MPKFGLLAIAAGVLALLVAGCGGSEGSGGVASVAAKSEVNKACEGTPRHGGNLVYARAGETVSLDPQAPTGSLPDVWTDNMLYTGLVKFAPENTPKVVPAVAKSWDVSDGGKTYTFHLRPGMKFSNGEPVTAEDVKFSMERFGDPKINQILVITTAGYESTEIVNPSTVRVHLSEPIAAFLNNISIVPGSILPKKLLEKEGEAFWKHPVGTGPFRVKEFVPGSHITMERNPYYFEKDKPYLDTVRYNFVTESNSRILALKNGQAQIADGVPFTQIESLQADPEFAVQLHYFPNTVEVSMSQQHPEFADLNVRKAIQYALNREQINQQIFRGVGTTPNSILPAFAIDAPASQVKPYEYDIEKANEYMAKSKFPNGFSTTFVYPSGYEYIKQLALLIQQDLGAIGIDVKLTEVDPGSAYEKWLNREFEMIIAFPTETTDTAVPDEFLEFYRNPETHGFSTDWTISPQIEQNIQTFVTTPNEAARAELWPVLQQELLEQTPAVALANVPLVIANQQSVCGASVNPIGADQLQLVWLAS
jgi:peptide/nickel transport system substrate-binding protein